MIFFFFFFEKLAALKLTHFWKLSAKDNFVFIGRHKNIQAFPIEMYKVIN